MPFTFDNLSLFEDPTPGDGPWNMAVDQSLLEHASNVPILRAYRWSTPYLSIGYFQRLDEIDNPLRLPVVRRWTGGGTVPHNGDFTFSLIVPKSHPFAALPPSETYCIIHRAIADALATSGIPALTLSPSPPPDAPSGTCFTSPVQDDIMSGDQKIAGGAQRRSQYGLLHQGSIQSLTPNKNFLSLLASRLATTHTLKSSLTPAESSRAQFLKDSRYATQAWQEKRK